VAADPFAERGWEMLMTALYRSGRQAAALGAFQRARAVLIEGAGLEPGPGLRKLEQRIIEQDRSLLRWSATATSNTEPGTASVPQAPSTVDSTARSEAEQGSHSIAADLSWFQTPTRLAGRRNELEAIEAAIAASRTENLPQVIMLGGDAGMGKTRLAGEAAQAASDAGIRVLYGACDPSISSAHRPISMAIERHLARDPGAFDHLPQSTLALLATISPALEDKVGPAGQHELSDADDDHRIIVSIGAWLASIADGQGLLLVLDDLHWASASTVALVTHRANNPIPIPMTVIATYRPRDLTDRSALTTALPTLLRHPRCRSIQLGRLSYQEMHDLVEQSAGHDVPEELTGHIERVTGGNPYPGGVNAAPHHQLRAGRAPESAVGAQARCTVAGVPPDNAIDAIETAALNGLVVEDGFDRWRWEHDLARNIVLDKVSTTRRVQTHWRLAQALFESDRTDLHDVAHHTTEGILAADPTVAAKYLVRASEHAIHREPRTALAYIECASEAISPGDDLHMDATLSILNAIAILEIAQDVHDPQFVAAAERAQALAVRAGDPDLILRAHIFDNRMPVFDHRFRNYDAHIESCWATLDALDSAQTDERAILLSHIERMCAFDVEGRERARKSLDAIPNRCLSERARSEIAAQQRTSRSGIRLLTAIANSPLDQSETPGSRLTTVDLVTHPDAETGATLDRITEMLRNGQLQSARDSLTPLIGNPTGDNAADLISRARLAVIQSATADVVGLRESLEWLNSFHSTAMLRGYLDEAIRGARVGLMQLENGLPDMADLYLEMADDPLIIPFMGETFRIGAAWTWFKGGHHAQAEAVLDEIIAAEQGLSGLFETAVMYAELVAHYRPELASSPEIVETLRGRSGEWIFVISLSLGPVDLYLAKLALASGDDPEPYLSSALTAAEGAGATFWLDQATQAMASLTGR
jgi:hypothetical protein